MEYVECIKLAYDSASDCVTALWNFGVAWSPGNNLISRAKTVVVYLVFII